MFKDICEKNEDFKERLESFGLCLQRFFCFESPSNILKVFLESGRSLDLRRVSLFKAVEV